MRKFMISALVLGSVLGAGATSANPGTNPGAAQHEGLIRMGAKLTELSAVCQHSSPAEVAKSKAEQRRESLKRGVTAERFDAVYAESAAEIRKKMAGLSAAQRQTTCDEMKAMAASMAGSVGQK